VQWLVFDYDGGAWRGLPPSTVDGCTLQGKDLLNYCLVNQGYAALGVSRNGAVVRLRPAKVSETALVCILYYLADLGGRRLAVDLFENGHWNCMILAGRKLATTSDFADLVARRLPIEKRAILRRALRPQSMPASCPLSQAIQAWSSRGGNRMPDLEPLLHQALKGRYAWVERETNTSPLVLNEIGDGFSENMKAYLQASVGRRIDEQPDPIYARYCRDAYGTAASTGEPLLEAVDVCLILPGQGEVRRTYRRLILPFQPKLGRLRLLCASIEDATVDLRGEAA
jgi:hypothetical protein